MLPVSVYEISLDLEFQLKGIEVHKRNIWALVITQPFSLFLIVDIRSLIRKIVRKLRPPILKFYQPKWRPLCAES